MAADERRKRSYLRQSALVRVPKADYPKQVVFNDPGYAGPVNLRVLLVIGQGTPYKQT